MLEKNKNQESELLDLARYEVKFSAQFSQYERYKAWLRFHEAGFYSPFRSRVINNVYFDTLELGSYQENMSGISSRSKLRLRWYGDMQEVDACNLELKLKRNKLGWKFTEEIELDVVLQRQTWREVLSQIKSQISNEMKARLLLCDTPSLINSYTREYFVSADNLIRVTLDKDIKFFDQRMSIVPNLCFNTNAPSITILEVKNASKDLDVATKVLNSMDMTPSKSSKYVIGIQSILGV